MPETPKTPPVTGKGELGAPGLEVYGGYVVEEFVQELSGQKALKVYREMAHNSATVGAILFAVRMLIRQAEWTVKPASPDPADEEAAEFLRACMEDMRRPWGQFVDEILSMLVYGFSVHEIVYKRRTGGTVSRYDDGKVGWADMPIRGQMTIERWDLDDHARELLGLYQQAPPRWEQVYIPADKFLLFRPSAHKDNPEGMSVLRTAYRAWYFQKRIENLEGVGIERDLCGLPVAWIPSYMTDTTASPEDKVRFESFKRLVTQIRQDEQAGVVMPLSYDEDGNKLFDLTLLSTGGERQFDTNAIITRYDQRIAMSVLADFLLIGHEKTGSFALASTKTELFSTALGTWLDAIQQVLNRHAVVRLFALNPEFRVERLPTFEHMDVEAPDLTELGNFITALVGAGMPLFPDHELESYLKRAANLPVTDPDELEHEDRTTDPRVAPPTTPPPEEETDETTDR